MSDSDYTKVYEGSFILSTRIKNELENQGVKTFIKDKGESSRLSGYPTTHNNYQEIFVENDDADKAFAIVNRVKAEMDATP